MELPVIDNVIRETRSHPYTMLALVGLLLAVPYLYVNSASAQDVVNIQSQLHEVQDTIRRTALEQRIAAVETELFALTQRIQDKISAHQKPDQLYYDRTAALAVEKAQLERNLGALH